MGVHAFTNCRVYNKALEYVKTFAKFNTTDSASAVRECVITIPTDLPYPDKMCCFSRILRREPALTQFETAQIANLCPADAEEAKSVIPRYVCELNDWFFNIHVVVVQQFGKDRRRPITGFVG